MGMTKKQILLDCIKNSIADIFYYNRKGDGDLSTFDVKELIEEKRITGDEIVETFKKSLQERYRSQKLTETLMFPVLFLIHRS